MEKCEPWFPSWRLSLGWSNKSLNWQTLSKACKQAAQPFKIKDKLSNLTYHLKLPLCWRIHNVFYVNILLEAKPNMIPQCQQPVQPPVMVNNKVFWVMEKYVSSSRYDGMDFQKSMTLGKTWMASILTIDPESCKRTTIISIWKRISIVNTLMLWRELTLLLLEGSLPDNRGYAISPWGHGPLVGGTVMILLFFLCFFPLFFYSALFCCFCSTPDPWSTDFSIFHQLLPHIMLLGSAVLTDMTS